MPSAVQQKLGRILKRASVEYQARFVWTALTWDTDTPYDPAYTPPIRAASSIDLAPHVASWEATRRVRQLAANLTLTLKASLDDATLRQIDYNDLIEVSLIVSAGGEAVTVNLGAYFVDRIPEPAEEVGQAGEWVIEARDAAKLLQRRRYYGRLEPSRIRVPASGFVALSKQDKPGLDYIEFFHDPTGLDAVLSRTINWCSLPKPVFRVLETSESVVPDDENVRVLFGDGLVRIGREWFADNIGTNNTLQVAYYRYAQWEDTFGAAYDLNSPMDIVLDMALWAGFQDTDPNALLYIERIDDVTFPMPFDKVFGHDGTDHTDDAATGGDIAGANLYLGVLSRRFPAVHWSLKTAATHSDTTPQFCYDYWDGAQWVEITPDQDTTDDLRQSGFVSWFGQDLSAWVVCQPLAVMPEGYYIRVRQLNGIGVVSTLIMAGHPIQCQDSRLTTDDDLVPEDVLERLVRPSVPPNYRWEGTRTGGFAAVLDVANIADPDFELVDETRVSISPERPHEDDLKTVVTYRGQARERLNAALAQNGGACWNLVADPDEATTFYRLIDGNTRMAINFAGALGTLPAAETVVFRIDLGCVRGEIDLREIRPYTQNADTPITITPGTGGVTWADNAFGTAVTDDSDATWKLLIVNLGWITYADDHQRVNFATPKSINRVDLRLSNTDIRRSVRVEIKLSGETNWRLVAAVSKQIGAAPETVSLTNLRLHNVVGLRINGPIMSSIWDGIGKLYELDLFGPDSSELIGTWSAIGGVGDVDDLHDGNTVTGMVFAARGEGFQVDFTTPGLLDYLEVFGIIHGNMLVEYQVDGGSVWEPGIFLTPMPECLASYTALGWANVAKVRFRVLGTTPVQELSAIEVYTPAYVSEETTSGRMVVPAKWRIEYQDASDFLWYTLCSEADGAAFEIPKSVIDRGMFGPEIFARALRFTILAWGKDENGNSNAWIGEIKVWIGDTLYGKAVLGLTAPFDSAADLALQGRLGWKTKTYPIDVTATTQETVDYRALQLLREQLRMPYTLYAVDLRYDVGLGQTARLPEHVRLAYDLPYVFYLVTEAVIGAEGATTAPLVECLLLP